MKTEQEQYGAEDHAFTPCLETLRRRTFPRQKAKPVPRRYRLCGACKCLFQSLVDRGIDLGVIDARSRDGQYSVIAFCNDAAVRDLLVCFGKIILIILAHGNKTVFVIFQRSLDVVHAARRSLHDKHRTRRIRHARFLF